MLMFMFAIMDISTRAGACPGHDQANLGWPMKAKRDHTLVLYCAAISPPTAYVVGNEWVNRGGRADRRWVGISIHN